jgi:hypothetical protein
MLKAYINNGVNYQPPLKDILQMKTLVLAAAAALTFGTAAAADDFDTNFFTTTVTTGDLEFSASTTVDSNVEGFGNDFGLRAGYTVLEYNSVFGPADVEVYGAYASVADEDLGALGAVYTAMPNMGEGVALELAVDGSYMFLTDDFSGGEFFVTPSANLEIDLTTNLAVWGEVGNTWVVSEDMTDAGGYAALGLDVGITESVALRPSISRDFGAGAGDDLSAGLEVTLDF